MIKGSITALVTPFRDGRVDETALKALVDWQIEEGAHGLSPCGTTGESPTLTHEEHERVIEVVVKAVAGRVPVVAGAGSNSTDEAIRFMRFAEAVGTPPGTIVVPARDSVTAVHPMSANDRMITRPPMMRPSMLSGAQTNARTQASAMCARSQTGGQSRNFAPVIGFERSLRCRMGMRGARER